jgi:hypothetical protein
VTRSVWNFRFFRLARRALSALPVLAFSTACLAQNCALCYTQAASAGSRVIQGLRSGILVLMIPPMFMSVGITLLAYRKRNQFSGRDSSDSSRDEW